jgi:hypothetical protein
VPKGQSTNASIARQGDLTETQFSTIREIARLQIRFDRLQERVLADEGGDKAELHLIRYAGLIARLRWGLGLTPRKRTTLHAPDLAKYVEAAR